MIRANRSHSSSATRCIVRIDKDGLVYVCDRSNNRLQIFRKDGGFVAEHIFERATRHRFGLRPRILA